MLTGLVRCGSCGWRLQTSHSEKGHSYHYRFRHHSTGESQGCPGLQAACVDRLVAELVLKAVEPAALAACLHACEAVEQNREQVPRVRR